MDCTAGDHFWIAFKKWWHQICQCRDGKEHYGNWTIKRHVRAGKSWLLMAKLPPTCYTLCLNLSHFLCSAWTCTIGVYVLLSLMFLLSWNIWRKFQKHRQICPAEDGIAPVVEEIQELCSPPSFDYPLSGNTWLIPTAAVFIVEQ